MAERVRVWEIDDDEGRRPLWIIRRGRGSVVTWRRAQMVLLSAQGIDVAKIAEVTFTSADTPTGAISSQTISSGRAPVPAARTAQTVAVLAERTGVLGP